MSDETSEDRRAPEDEQPIQLAVAEELGVLPETDRRQDQPIIVSDSEGEEYVWVDDGSEVPNPDQPADVGALIHRDNATSPGHANGGNTSGH